MGNELRSTLKMPGLDKEERDERDIKFPLTSTCTTCALSLPSQRSFRRYRIRCKR